MSGPSAPDAARNCDKNALTSGDEVVDPDDTPPGDAATSGLVATAASGVAGALDRTTPATNHRWRLLWLFWRFGLFGFAIVLIP